MPRRPRYRLPLSITPRTLSDGTNAFTATKSLGYTADGKRRRIRGQAPDLPGAVARVVVLLQRAGEVVAAEDITAAAVAQFGEHFRRRIADETPSSAPILLDALVDHLDRRHQGGHLARASYDRALGHVRNHIEPHRIAKMRLDEVTSTDLRAFHDGLWKKTKPDGQPLFTSATPIRSIHGYLSQLFTWAEEEQIVARSPMRSVERPAKPHRKTSGIGTKRGAVERTERLMQEIPYADYLFLLPLALGLRTNERLGLVHDSFHLAEDALDLTVDAQLGADSMYPQRVPLKTENSRRTLPLPLDVLPHIDALYLERLTRTGQAAVEFTSKMLAEAESIRASGGYLRNASGAVTGSPLIGPDLFLYVDTLGKPPRHQTAGKRWDRIRRTYGADEGDWKGHDFRHVARTILEAERFPDATIKGWLGHSHGGAITGVYGHVGRDEFRAAGEAIWKRFRRWPEPTASADAVEDLAMGLFQGFRHEFWRPSTQIDRVTEMFYLPDAHGELAHTLPPAQAARRLSREHGLDLGDVAYREAWLPAGHRFTPDAHMRWAREHSH